jgi:hypothetical protein
MTKTYKRVAYGVALILLLLGGLAGCSASGSEQAAIQGQSDPSGSPVVTVFKAPT